MPDRITVNNGTENVIYEVTSPEKNGSILRDVSSTLSEPRTLRVAHTIASKPGGQDSHLVQLNVVKNNVDDLPETGSVHVVLKGPRDTVTEADLLAEWTKLKNLVDSKFSEIYGGFLPFD